MKARDLVLLAAVTLVAVLLATLHRSRERPPARTMAAPTAAGPDRVDDSPLLAPTPAREAGPEDSAGRGAGTRTSLAAPDAPGPAVVEFLARRIRGDEPGAPIAGLRLRYATEHLQVLTHDVPGTTDRDGRLRLTLEEPGDYVFSVATGSLPADLRMPEPPRGELRSFDGRTRTPPAPRRGDAFEVIECPAGETTRVELWFQQASWIEGRVTDELGRPVEGARVAPLSGLGGEAGFFGFPRVDSLTSDADGFYRTPNLRPGTYRVRVERLDDAAATTPEGVPLGELALPTSDAVELRDGEWRRVDLALGTGSLTLVGRVLDEAGAPFAGLPVEAYLVAGPDAEAPAGSAGRLGSGPRPLAARGRISGRTTTDAEGRFRLRGLPRGAFLLALRPGETIETGFGHGQFVLGPTQVEVRGDPDELGRIDVGELEAPRPKLFRLRGHVVLTTDRVRDLPLNHARVTLRTLAETPTGASGALWDYDRDTGAFDVLCLLPCNRLVVRVRSRKYPDEYHDYDFEPREEIREGLELEYP